MSQAGMTPPIAGRLDVPKPGPQELAAFYRLHRHWRIAEPPLPAPLVIHRRRVEPLVTPPEVARFAPTRINRLDLDQPREIEVCLQRIDDAVLIPAKKGFCLLQGDRIHPLSPAFPMFRRARLTIARSLERLAYTGDMYTSDNIAHFVLDAVVRGYFAKTFAGFAEDEIGFSASRLPYCNHFRSVAFPGARVLEWGRAYHVEALYIFVHLHHPAQAVFRPALDFLAGLGAAAAGRPLGPCLYVSRRDRARRRLVNEAELEARLAELGFRIVVAGAFGRGGSNWWCSFFFTAAAGDPYARDELVQITSRENLLPRQAFKNFKIFAFALADTDGLLLDQAVLDHIDRSDTCERQYRFFRHCEDAVVPFHQNLSFRKKTRL
jgi:hypothetical protein